MHPMRPNPSQQRMNPMAKATENNTTPTELRSKIEKAVEGLIAILYGLDLPTEDREHAPFRDTPGNPPTLPGSALSHTELTSEYAYLG